MPWKSGVGVGSCRLLVDLVGDDRDLPCQPLDLLVGDGLLCGKLVDAPRKLVQMVDDLGRRPVLGDFLDLVRERRDARLDALEGLGIEIGHLRGRGRCDDGARNLVETLFDEREGFRCLALLLAHEMLDGAGKRADLVLERAQRQ